MKSIFILSFIIVLATAKFGADASYYQVSRNFFTCLSSQQNVTLSILEILDETGTLNKDFLINYIYSKDAKIQNFDAVVMVNDTFAPEDVCSGVAKALPASFNGTVWLNVENKNGLWSRDIDARIPYLEDLTKACQNHGLKPGVYSSADVWSTLMGSQGAGSDTLKVIPVWYFNDNGSADFSDFEYAGFGTWDSPQMKNYGTNSYLCGAYVTSFNYYEV